MALALLARPLFVGLGRTDLDGDESIYAGVVERMVDGGPWLTPTEENGPFLEKPPVRFWLVAAAMRLGLPRTEAGHRAVDAAFGAAALLYVFLLARRVGGTASGLGAAFLLITQSALLFAHGLRSGTMEPLLVLSYCGGVFHFLRWAEGAGRGHATAVGAWGAAAILAKTFAAIPLFAVLLLAGAVVPAWRARAAADARPWWRSALLCAGLVAPWFLFELGRQGPAVWHSMFVEHVVTRVTASVDPAHLQPWWFYPAFVAGTLGRGWPYVLGGAIVLAARRETRPAAVLLGLWLVVPVLLFSLAASKLPHYVYPALPALAVVGGQVFGAVARAIGDVRRREPLPPRARWAAAVAAALGLALAAAVVVSGPLRADLGPLSARTARPERPLAVAAAGILAVLGRRRAAAAVLALGLAASEVDREYGRALETARVARRPLGGLVDCIAVRSGGERRIRVAVARPLFRDERYYFARVGWRHWRPDPDHLTRRMRDPERDTPLVLDYASYRALVPRMQEWPAEVRGATGFAPVRDRDLYVLLPGRFHDCAAAAAAAP